MKTFYVQLPTVSKQGILTKTDIFPKHQSLFVKNLNNKENTIEFEHSVVFWLFSSKYI